MSKNNAGCDRSMAPFSFMLDCGFTGSEVSEDVLPHGCSPV